MTEILSSIDSDLEDEKFSTFSIKTMDLVDDTTTPSQIPNKQNTGLESQLGMRGPEALVKFDGYRVPELVVVLHMMRTHHSLQERPVISFHEHPDIGSLESHHIWLSRASPLRSFPIKGSFMSFPINGSLELPNIGSHELPEYGSYELPVMSFPLYGLKELPITCSHGQTCISIDGLQICTL
ncbi:hypothetical protein Gotur_010981, partial [Gossypium turneri]